jgi:signal peptide peptidase SppA
MSHVLRAMEQEAWALMPAKLQAIAEIVAVHERLSREEIEARVGDRRESRNQSRGAVAVIPVVGVLSHRMGMFTDISGGTSVQGLQQAFRTAVEDPNVGAIVLDIDSPGGAMSGVSELANEIFAARDRKRIVAVANTLAASGGYWLAAAAHELVATPTAMVGSVGVFAVHRDRSAQLEKEGVRVTLISAGKHKVDGADHQPLSDDARAAMQALVDEGYALFVRDLAKFRDVAPSAIREGYGEGRVLAAKAAKAEGMVDRIATLDETISRLGVSHGSNRIAMAEEAPVEVAAEAAAPVGGAAETAEAPELGTVRARFYED